MNSTRIHDLGELSKQGFYPLLHCMLLFLSVCLLVHSNSIFETPPPISLSSLPAPDHSRSEMDLSVPGSDPSSDEALSLRSRSVPGLNETVSSISPSLLPASALSPHTVSPWILIVASSVWLWNLQRQFEISVHAPFKCTHLMYYNECSYQALDLWFNVMRQRHGAEC